MDTTDIKKEVLSLYDKFITLSSAGQKTILEKGVVDGKFKEKLKEVLTLQKQLI